jgi:hypothetical protein
MMQLMAGCIAAKIGMAAPFEVLSNPEMRRDRAIYSNLKFHWRNPKFMRINRPRTNKSDE